MEKDIFKMCDEKILSDGKGIELKAYMYKRDNSFNIECELLNDENKSNDVTTFKQKICNFYIDLENKEKNKNEISEITAIIQRAKNFMYDLKKYASNNIFYIFNELTVFIRVEMAVKIGEINSKYLISNPIPSEIKNLFLSKHYNEEDEEEFQIKIDLDCTKKVLVLEGSHFKNHENNEVLKEEIHDQNLLYSGEFIVGVKTVLGNAFFNKVVYEKFGYDSEIESIYSYYFRMFKLYKDKIIENLKSLINDTFVEKERVEK